MSERSIPLAGPAVKPPAQQFRVGQRVEIKHTIHYFGGLTGTIKRTYPGCDWFGVSLDRDAAPDVVLVDFEASELMPEVAA